MSASDRQAPPINVKSLQGGYHGQAVIHDCSMEIQAGEIVVIMGGSGSGKSTFLRHLIGLMYLRQLNLQEITERFQSLQFLQLFLYCF